MSTTETTIRDRISFIIGSYFAALKRTSDIPISRADKDGFVFEKIAESLAYEGITTRDVRSLVRGEFLEEGKAVLFANS
jgi:hypothetical protein